MASKALDQKIERLKEQLDKLGDLSEVEPNVAELFERLLDLIEGQTETAVEYANRVLELATLNKIGQALSSAATLHIEEICELVYAQTSLLMDTTNFYVALYDANSDTVSFPFAVEEGKRREPVAEWASRKAGHGLTERIIHYRVPLLIPNSFDEWMQAHANEVKPIGQPAKSWLGVPLVTGNQVIGIIAVQSHQQENLYDHHDLTTLSTIASQTAIAISNARLFKSAQRQIGELSLDRVVG